MGFKYSPHHNLPQIIEVHCKFSKFNSSHIDYPIPPSYCIATSIIEVYCTLQDLAFSFSNFPPFQRLQLSESVAVYQRLNYPYLNPPTQPLQL